MYIRIRQNASKTTWKVMICRSTRHGSRVSQEIVKYLGTAKTEGQLAALKRLGLVEIRSLELGSCLEETVPDLCEGAPLSQMVEIARISEGCHEVFGATFDSLNLTSMFDKSVCEHLKDLVVGRIDFPSTKRHTSRLLAKNYGRQLSEDSIYRLMDRFVPFEQGIQEQVFKTTKQFCDGQTIDVLLFDVTTLYFESQQSDELRDFGYSKDRKINEVQVVLALATTKDGLPIGYTLFPGKTAEVKTLLHCLNTWKTSFPIQSTSVVADRAMMSEQNLQAMEQASFSYVIAAKLRSLPQKTREAVLQRHSEVELSVSDECMKVQEHIIDGRRLIVSYSESRAHKDRSDRERLLARLAQKAPTAETSTKRLVTNRGYLKFFREKTSGKMVLDEDLVAKEAQWDGLHGVITNDITSRADCILQRYRRLWVIEDSFRVNKHTLEMRPIYHFKPRRVRAHILLCYLAFAISRYTQRQISQFSESMSIDRIREALSSVETSILEDLSTGERHKLPSAMSQDAKIIYKSVGLRRAKHPCKIVSKHTKCSGPRKIEVIDN